MTATAFADRRSTREQSLPSDVSHRTLGRLVLSRHAIERYCERVRPAADMHDAAAELQRVLPALAAVSERPSWYRGDGPSDQYLMWGEDICFMLLGCKVMTCVVRGGLGDGQRAARNKSRAVKRRTQKRRGQSRGAVRSLRRPEPVADLAAW